MLLDLYPLYPGGPFGPEVGGALLLDLAPLQDAAVLPSPPVPSTVPGGYVTPRVETRRVRTILRYRLHITGWGAVQHHTPEPVAVRATTTTTTVPVRVGARTEVPCHMVIDSSALTARTETVWTASRTDTVRIDDPDEWVVLDDLTLS